MRSTSGGNVKEKGGFREINLFPSISKSFLGAQAVVHRISTKANAGRKSFLVFIFFEGLHSPLSLETVS